MKLSKLHWPIIAAGLIALVSFVVALSPAFAESVLISNHNEDAAAKSAGIVYLHEMGCTFPKVARSGSFPLTDNGDKTLTLVETFKFTCLEWRASAPDVVVTPSYTSVLLTYTAPTTRANGSALAPSEIKAYTIYQEIDGAFKSIGTTSALSYTVQGLAKGDYVFALSTVDVNGLESFLSQSVEVTLK